VPPIILPAKRELGMLSVCRHSSHAVIRRNTSHGTQRRKPMHATISAASTATRPSLGERLTVDRETGEIVERFASADAPDGVVLVACGNRRASRCPSCSTTYRRDAYALVRAGLAGDQAKGVSAGLASHPRVFATLTAPSFGAVHRRVVRGASIGPCHRGASDPTCVHGRPVSCRIRHEKDEPVLGQPLCPQCYD
jgi:uncharacterized Zn-finger protein